MFFLFISYIYFRLLSFTFTFNKHAFSILIAAFFFLFVTFFGLFFFWLLLLLTLLISLLLLLMLLYNICRLPGFEPEILRPQTGVLPISYDSPLSYFSLSLSPQSLPMCYAAIFACWMGPCRPQSINIHSLAAEQSQHPPVITTLQP